MNLKINLEVSPSLVIRIAVLIAIVWMKTKGLC